jgi:hypothetical protein
MSLVLAEDIHALVGRDLEAKLGERVVLTSTARKWEIEKANRGDNGGGGTYRSTFVSSFFFGMDDKELLLVDIC